MPLNIAISGSTRCTILKFRDYYLGDPSRPSVGGQDAWVTRSGSTWQVSAGAAECVRPDGTFEPITLSVSFTIQI